MHYLQMAFQSLKKWRLDLEAFRLNNVSRLDLSCFFSHLSVIDQNYISQFGQNDQKKNKKNRRNLDNKLLGLR